MQPIRFPACSNPKRLQRHDRTACCEPLGSNAIGKRPATASLAGIEYGLLQVILRFLIFVVIAAAGFAQNPEALFQTHCAGCHSENNAVGAPLPGTLRQMSWQSILAALESGKMKGIGNGIGATQREAIAKLLGTAESQPFLASARCSTQPERLTGDWNGWSDAANTRFQPARAAGLTSQTTPKLKLKWAFGFPGQTTAFGTPTVFGGKIFVGAADGMVYSLDARSGCVYWIYAAAGGVRASPVLDAHYAYFGDLRGNVYAVDSATGALRWKTRADEHPLAVITGSPKLESGRLYVPVSGRDESIAAINPSYECCTFRGSVVALDAASGNVIWQAYTISDAPKITGRNAKGAKTWGPSGAVPWSSPTLDLQKRVLYLGTGVNYSQPPTQTSDAIVAFDMDSGRLLWSRQLTAGDAYNFACGAPGQNELPEGSFHRCRLRQFRDLALLGWRQTHPGGKRQIGGGVRAGSRSTRQDSLETEDRFGRSKRRIHVGRRQRRAGSRIYGHLRFHGRKNGHRRRSHRATSGDRREALEDAGSETRLCGRSWMQRRSARSGDRDTWRGVSGVVGWTHPRLRNQSGRNHMGFRYGAGLPNRQRREGAWRLHQQHGSRGCRRDALHGLGICVGDGHTGECPVGVFVGRQMSRQVPAAPTSTPNTPACSPETQDWLRDAGGTSAPGRYPLRRRRSCLPGPR